MKATTFLVAVTLSAAIFAGQPAQLPHGTVFGTKPSITGMMDASKTEAFMGNKIRISTTIRGRVIKVTKQKGGWFELDAGKGKVIAAHFRDYNVTIPATLAGKIVIVEGIAQKQLIADDMQHFAGDTVSGKKQHTVKTDPNRVLTFEVKGLMVD